MRVTISDDLPTIELTHRRLFDKGEKPFECIGADRFLPCCQPSHQHMVTMTGPSIGVKDGLH
jgi:hypothetical protein